MNVLYIIFTHGNDPHPPHPPFSHARSVEQGGSQHFGDMQKLKDVYSFRKRTHTHAHALSHTHTCCKNERNEEQIILMGAVETHFQLSLNRLTPNVYTPTVSQ